MADEIGNNAAEQLRSFVERLERLGEEKKGIAHDMKDVMSEAKANGYHAKTINKMIALRKMETHARQEMLTLEETYMAALGLL